MAQISLCITLEWEMEKSKNGKRRQKLISASWFSFPQHTWPLSRCIQILKTLALIEAEKSVTEIFIGEKEKWTNNGNDQQEEAGSLLHNSIRQSIQQIIPNIYTTFQNPRFSSSRDIFAKKKKFTHTHTQTHTHCYGKDKKYSRE